MLTDWVSVLSLTVFFAAVIGPGWRDAASCR
ncbi:hypothetical protein L584_07795 [Pantoea agglomerans Tx10]|nr:hypothetical protein L584_07795 [Pantoea agglomerans Tx10]